MAASARANHDPVAQWTAVASAVESVQQAVLAQVGKSGIPAQCFAVLQLLHAAPDERLPMTAIARGLSMTSGGFTKMADRMARDGLIDRRGAAGDRRVTHAVLTELGRTLARESAQVYADAVNALVLAAIPADDLHTVAGIVLRLNPVPEPEATPEAEDRFVVRPRRPTSRDRRKGSADRTPAAVHQLHPAP